MDKTSWTRRDDKLGKNHNRPRQRGGGADFWKQLSRGLELKARRVQARRGPVTVMCAAYLRFLLAKIERPHCQRRRAKLVAKKNFAPSPLSFAGSGDLLNPRSAGEKGKGTIDVFIKIRARGGGGSSMQPGGGEAGI